MRAVTLTAKAHAAPPMQHVKAICLDLDDTLWELGPVIVRAEQGVHAWFAAHYPAVTRRCTLEGMRRMRLAVEREHPGRAHDLPFLRRTTFARLARDADYLDPGIPEAAFAEFQRLRNQLVPFTDVGPALERLAQRGPVVALTNGTADLAAVGLRHHFAAVFMADAIGAAKPDARAFHAVCDALGFAPGEVLHAGDSPRHDVLGAHAAGLAAVWIDRGLHAWPGGVDPPAHRVVDLGALADLVGA
jgi:FMN hydrolase / 5-amino-6-(5-phospho-D-ribitylamino)uracil phosphatase